MALVGTAAFIFAVWFCQFYCLYLNCIVMPVSWILASCGIQCARQVVKAYRYSL